MAYRYQHRDPEDWERRSERQGGFEGIIKDDFRTFRPKKDENTIRILPPTWEDAKHYGYDIWAHYNVGPDKAAVLCLQKMKNKPCPCCEERARLDKDGDDEAAKEMKPRQGVVTWILNKNERDAKDPVIFVMSGNMDTDICKVSKDRGTGELFEIDDPDNGYDVSFDRDGEGLRTRYTGYQVARRPSSVPKRVVDFVEDNPIPTVLRWRDYDQIVALLEGSGSSARGNDRDRRKDRDDDRRSSRDDDARPSRRARDEEDDRPSSRSRSSRDDDEPPRGRFPEDEDERPPRRRRDEEDDEPRGSRRRAADEDAPRSRSRDADPDDDPPRRGRNGQDADADEAPRRGTERRRLRDDPEEAPARRGRDEDDDERPSRRSRDADADPPPRTRSAGLRDQLNARRRDD